jgi:hypothetical protein
MKRPELYKKTCDILYDAYFNDTLEHGNCYACAVGNIIAANMGYSFLTQSNENDADETIWTGRGTKYWDRDNNFNNNPVALIADGSIRRGISPIEEKQIKSTGYNRHELTEIENAFERNIDLLHKDKAMFNGLVAVIEALNEIHEVQEDNQTERFKRVYETKVSV